MEQYHCGCQFFKSLPESMKHALYGHELTQKLKQLLPEHERLYHLAKEATDGQRSTRI